MKLPTIREINRNLNTSLIRVSRPRIPVSRVEQQLLKRQLCRIIEGRANIGSSEVYFVGVL